MLSDENEARTVCGVKFQTIFFTFVDFWIEVFSIHSGTTSNAPVLSNLQEQQLINRTFEGQDGFYIHLKGFYNLTQYLTISFAAFNIAKPGKCVQG